VVYVVEGIDVKFAVFANPTLLITVSTLSTITAWRLTIKGFGAKKGDVALHREATLRGTTGKVTYVTASKGWSMVVAACNVSLDPRSVGDWTDECRMDPLQCGT
jgi:hypothetical protein